MVSVGALLLTSFFVYEETWSHLADSQEKMSAISDNIGLGLVHHLVVKDYAEIELILLHAAKYPGIRSIAVTDRTGKVLSAVRNNGGKAAEAIYDLRNVKLPADQLDRLTWNYGKFQQPNPLAFGLDATELEYWHPIEKGDLGWLNIVYSVAEVKEDAFNLAKISLLTVLFGILLQILIVSRLLKPSLSALSDAADFARSLVDVRGQQLPVFDENSEMEQLGEALNATSLRLHSQDMEIRESHENLKRLLDSMAEGAYGMDINGNCTFVNSAFLNMLGYDSADEVIGKHMHTLMHHTRVNGENYPAKECKILSLMHTLQSQVHVDDEVFWRKDGIAIPVEYWARTIIHEGKVMGAISTFVDITERLKAEKEIQLLAFYDPLTGLPNRRLFQERLKQSLVSGVRSGKAGALLLIDLDNFKTLNDSLGHHIGDLLLKQTARRLESCVREGDSIARLGGDEFIVLLENLSEQPLEAAAQTRIIGEKVLAALSMPYQLETKNHHGAASIGASVFRGSDLKIDDLIKQADIAMYQAKKAGRNALRFFDQNMQATISAHVVMEEELRLALEEEQFELYYQMQIDSSNLPIGAEALIRWKHPVKGIVPPLDFISLAEETGLIQPIGDWVLNKACAQIKEWQKDELTRSLVLSVNVSAKEFRQAAFADQVRNAIVRHEIDPNLLKLELTEGLMLENIKESVAIMNKLNEIGVQLSLDDFGTGYSSLQYLKSLPLDQLKIDQSFVRDIATDFNDMAIVRTIIAMAQSMSLDVIAEGVETVEQHRFLKTSGCNQYQGYLFGRPVPVTQFMELLKQFK